MARRAAASRRSRAWIKENNNMVRIEAIIRPSRLDEVKAALDDLGVHGISVLEIKGAGKQKGYTQHYRGSEYQVNLLPKVQLIVVVPDEMQERVIEAIEGSARTGEIGDGKIFVTPVRKPSASAPASAATPRSPKPKPPETHRRGAICCAPPFLLPPLSVDQRWAVSVGAGLAGVLRRLSSTWGAL